MPWDVKKIVGDLMAAVNSQDVNKVLSFYTDDVIYENVARGSVYRGKKEFTAALNSSFGEIPDMKYELKSVFATGDWAASEYVFSGSHTHTLRSVPGVPSTCKTFSVRAVSIYQIRKGKISRQSEYYNLATLLQRVGLMPG